MTDELERLISEAVQQHDAEGDALKAALGQGPAPEPDDPALAAFKRAIESTFDERGSR